MELKKLVKKMNKALQSGGSVDICDGVFLHSVGNVQDKVSSGIIFDEPVIILCKNSLETTTEMMITIKKISSIEIETANEVEEKS